MRMEEQRKQKLERMLRAVQDIKTEYYVGTKEAYNTIKKLQEVREGPIKTAGYINRSLNRKFENPSYLATPERVGGIEGVLFEAANYASQQFLNNEAELCPEYHLQNFDFFKVFRIESDVDDKPENSAILLIPYFIQANKINAEEDSLFGIVFQDYLLKKYKEVRWRIEEKMQPACDTYMLRGLHYLEDTDWNNLLSEQSFNIREREIAKYIMASKISTGKILDRMLNDRIDHRLEYRRQVLCKWLRDCGFKDYEEAFSSNQELLKMREERLQKFTAGNCTKNMIYDVKRLVRISKFLRHLLGSEKNFVKKFLKN